MEKKKYGFWVKFTVILYSLPTMLETASISPTVEGAISAWGIEPSLASWIGTISCITIVIGNFLAVPLVQRFSKKTVLIAGGILWTVGGVLNAFMPNIYGIFVMRLIGGLGAGIEISVATMLIPILWPDEKETNRVMGAFGVMVAVWGTVLTPMVGWLMQTLGWNYGFFIFFIGVPMLLFFIAFIPKALPTENEVSENRKMEKSEKAKLPVSVYMLTGSGIIYAVLTTTFFVYIVSLFTETGAGDVTQGSLAISVETLASFLAGLVLAYFYGKAKNFVPGICWFLMAIASFILVATSDMMIMYAGSFLFGLGYGTYFPYLYARGAKLCTPETNDRVMALVNVGYFLGYFFASFYISIVAGIFNNETAVFSFEFMGIACAVAGVAFIIKAIQERISIKNGKNVII